MPPDPPSGWHPRRSRDSSVIKKHPDFPYSKGWTICTFLKKAPIQRKHFPFLVITGIHELKIKILPVTVKQTFPSCHQVNYFICSSRKYPFPPRRALLLYTPPPSTPWNFLNFSTWEGIPWKEIYVKNNVSLYHYAKVHCFCDKERKNASIHVNTVSNYLNFAL